MAAAEMLTDEAALVPIVDGWAEIATLNSAATCSPAWMLAWWRHLAPAGAQLRLIAIHDGIELIGILPFCTDPALNRGRGFRLLAGDISSSVSPLAQPGRVWDVAEAAGELLSQPGHRPETIEMSPTPAFSPWKEALRETWPGPMRPVAYRRNLNRAPTVTFKGSFEEWLGTRSSNFRSNARRRRKRFHGAGGTYRLTDIATLNDDVATLVELHRKRWKNFSHPSHWLVHGEAIHGFLRDVGAELLADGNFRLVLVELDGEPIGAELAIAAGRDSDSVNVGWDERFKQYAPSTLTLLHLIEDGFHRGDRRLHLGYGMVDYKMSIANGQDAVATDVLLPPGGTLPGALLRAAPDVAARRAKESARRILPPETFAQARSRLRGEG
jgi:CelD/BcsL family acetyltransferase involved in cellulose biosynthesis